MIPESQQAIINITSTDVRIMCLTVVILVVALCVTWLIHNDKIGILSWNKGQGLKFEVPDNGNEVALEFVDRHNDNSLDDFKRTLISNSYECFKDNPNGQQYATYVAALNHCLRDISRIGYKNYVAEASRKGKWSAEEAQCFMQGLLLAARKMIDERLDTYRKCMQLRSSGTFRKITQGKIDKNLEYSKMVNRYLAQHGMGSEVIAYEHNVLSGILSEKQQEKTT